ncbi:hypothetical protein [Demequina gelatinilytica]|nr:hypothetical protein [Demequina gelatinilytica]
MSDEKVTDTRHYKFEQIKAKELARGASEDEATRIATAMVDKVMEQDSPS